MSRIALIFLSGVLLLGGIACGSTSSEATCTEWHTVYDEGYKLGGGAGQKVIGQKCVRWKGDSSKKAATTPTTRASITSGCIKTTKSESGTQIDYSACR